MAFVYWYVRDFFLFIADLIKTVFELLENVLNILIAAVSFLVKVIGSFPVFITVPVGALIIVCVLYKILGRENQS